MKKFCAIVLSAFLLNAAFVPSYSRAEDIDALTPEIKANLQLMWTAIQRNAPISGVVYRDVYLMRNELLQYVYQLIDDPAVDALDRQILRNQLNTGIVPRLIESGFRGAAGAAADYARQIQAGVPKSSIPASLAAAAAAAQARYLTSIMHFMPSFLVAASAVGISGSAFYALAMLEGQSFDQLNTVGRSYYFTCMKTAVCAAATLADDAASVLSFMMGGTLTKYSGGTYTDLGAVFIASRRYAWVDPNAIPNYTLYRFPDQTVILVSKDGKKILGTTTDGSTFVAVEMPNQPGTYSVTYANGVRGYLSSSGFVMNTPPPPPFVIGTGPGGTGAFYNPPTVRIADYDSVPNDGFTWACWWNGGTYYCGY